MLSPLTPRLNNVSITINKFQQVYLESLVPLADKGDKDAKAELLNTFKVAHTNFETIVYCKNRAHNSASISFVLANMYYFGESGGYQVYKDDIQAMDYLRQSSRLGNKDAEFYIGIMYYHGDGVAVDYAEAFRRFEAAYSSGHAMAAFELGNRYYKGEGTSLNLQKALFYYQEAHRRGVSGVDAKMRQLELYNEFRAGL